MATASAQDDTIDDTGRRSISIDTFNRYTDQTPSTYSLLDDAVAGATPSSRTEYSLATLWDAFDSQSTMPGPHGGLRPWPNIESAPRDKALRDAPSEEPRQQAPVAAMRSHYHSAQQPLRVSQQTSASSVRDMALRKGTSTILSQDLKSATRPLKSALKRYPSENREHAAHPQFLYPPEHEQPSVSAKQPSRRLRFGNLFSRRSSSNKSIPSPQVSRTSSTTSAASVGYATPTGPRLKRSIGWDQSLRQNDNSRTTSAQSDLSDVVRQAKLAEGDVYEKAKMNIRRPPKGITNWFDGLDISSDDDDLTPVVELPANEALPSTFTTFSPERSAAQEARQPSKNLEARQLTKAERVLGQRTAHAPQERTRPTHQYSEPYNADACLDHRATTPKASDRLRPGYDNSVSLGSSIDQPYTDTDGAERPSTAGQYSTQSDQLYNSTSTFDSHRPEIPPRRLQNAQIASHNAYHVNDRPRLISRSSSIKYTSRSQVDDDDGFDDRPSTSRKSSHRTMSDASRSRTRPSTHMSSSNGYDESNGGVPLDPTASDISRMMVVTEEEMALLEMMRNKRAAMQKNSYSEGYRQALKREHEQLMQRRMLAQQTALRILRSQKEDYTVQQQEDVDDREVDDREIKRLNKLRQQELDRSQRLEKFLAMDTSLAAALNDAGASQDSSLRDWPLREENGVRSPGADVRRQRKSGRPSSFTPRNVYDEDEVSTRQDKHITSATDDYEMALAFPRPPETSNTRHRQGFGREIASNLVRFDSTTTDTRDKSQRRSQTLYTKQTIEDAAFRHELYMMNSTSAKRSSKSSLPSRRQIQDTTFLRSISDYHPAENNSTTSQGSASISASIVSPVTPSSTGAGNASKLQSYGGIDSEDGDYMDYSSPELVFSKPIAGPRKRRQLPSALAILAESNPSSHRNSMASNNSAGEDVLAAWAELGGNEGMLPARSRRTRRA